MIVINKETLPLSVAKDVITLVLVCLLGHVNYKYLGGSEVIYAACVYTAYCVMKQIVRSKDLDFYNVSNESLSKIEKIIENDQRVRK